MGSAFRNPDRLTCQQLTRWLVRDFWERLNPLRDQPLWQHLGLTFDRLLDQPIYTVRPPESEAERGYLRSQQSETPTSLRDGIVTGRIIDSGVIDALVEAARTVHANFLSSQTGDPPIPIDARARTTHSPPLPTQKQKRSTVRGEARAKIVAVLTDHHQYADGSCLNQEPIGNNELARKAVVAKSTAKSFFDNAFRGHSKYVAGCRNLPGLIASLKLLNDEFSPHLLFGSTPPGEGERPDDE